MAVSVFPSLWPTLCEAATGRQWPPSTIEDGVAFVRRAMDEQLLPILYEGKALPDPVSRALATVRAAYLAHVARSTVIRKHLQNVAEILRTSGVEFIVLKGCDFGYRLYPKPHLRPVVDIDILVREGEMERTADLLVSADFTRFFPGTLSTRVSSHHETALGISNVVVDLHQRFLQKQRYRIDYDAIWNRAQPFEGEGFQALRLSDADAAAYLTLSVAIRYFHGAAIRYVDLWLLLSSNARCLEEAAHLAKEWRSTRAFYATLCYGTRMFPELRPLFERAMTHILGPATRIFLDRWVVPDKMLGRGGSRAEQLWRKYWLIDNAMLRTHSVAEHAVATVRGYFLART